MTAALLVSAAKPCGVWISGAGGDPVRRYVGAEALRANSA